VRLNQLARVLLHSRAGHEIARWPRGVSRHGPKQPSVNAVAGWLIRHCTRDGKQTMGGAPRVCARDAPWDKGDRRSPSARSD
jgi:hypothetical protein